MAKKIKFTFLGETYQLPENALRLKENNTWGEPNYIYMGAKNTASVIKQFIKKNYPHLKVWATSKVYSGGSSADIYVCNADATAINDTDYQTINTFANMFKAGWFNGMIDMYEYKSGELKADNGMPLKYTPKYIFLNNEPKYDSLEYWVAEYNKYEANKDNDNYINYVAQVNRLGGWLNFNQRYMKKGMDLKVKAELGL